MSSMKVALLILFFYVFHNVYCNKYKCSCSSDNSYAKCKSNATTTDLCFTCSNIECQSVAVVNITYPSECLADNVTTCCPNVTTLYIDNQLLCACYCPLEEYGVRVQSSSNSFQCNCNNKSTDMSTSISATSKNTLTSNTKLMSTTTPLKISISSNITTLTTTTRLTMTSLSPSPVTPLLETSTVSNTQTRKLSENTTITTEKATLLSSTMQPSPPPITTSTFLLQTSSEMSASSLTSPSEKSPPTSQSSKTNREFVTSITATHPFVQNYEPDNDSSGYDEIVLISEIVVGLLELLLLITLILYCYYKRNNKAVLDCGTGCVRCNSQQQRESTAKINFRQEIVCLPSLTSAIYDKVQTKEIYPSG